jgi:predicted peptidase
MDARMRSALRLACAALAAGGCASPGMETGPGPAADHRLVPPPDPADAAVADSVVGEIERLPEAPWEAHAFRAANGVELAYRLLRPAGEEGGRRHPLVVVFHGSGEIGTDNRRHLDRFPQAWARPAWRAAYPAFVVAPQMPERSANYTAPPGTPGRASVPAPPLFAALELVDSLVAALPVDPGRVYAVGFSMGGSTVWNALRLRPDRFAAAVPIAGVPAAEGAAEVARTPVWIVHGNRDGANPIEPDRAFFGVLAALPGARVRFWEYDGGEHRVPPALLAGDAVPRWLFSHRKPAGAP